MSTANSQNPFKSAIWPVAMAIVALIIGIKYSAPAIAWIIGGVVWAAGCGIEVYQYKIDEETLFPDVVCTIGFLIIAIWAAS